MTISIMTPTNATLDIVNDTHHGGGSACVKSISVVTLNCFKRAEHYNNECHPLCQMWY